MVSRKLEQVWEGQMLRVAESRTTQVSPAVTDGCAVGVHLPSFSFARSSERFARGCEKPVCS